MKSNACFATGIGMLWARGSSSMISTMESLSGEAAIFRGMVIKHPAGGQRAVRMPSEISSTGMWGGGARGFGMRGMASMGIKAVDLLKGKALKKSDNPLQHLADLRDPQTWYPTARRIKRKWIMHVGPTNSGKTYHALKRLAESKSGCYCGPLRLLAYEVHDKLCEGTIDGRKIECDLITGQEKILFEGSKHRFIPQFYPHTIPNTPAACLVNLYPERSILRSSTIEMVDLQKRVQVGVVDEMQMAANEDRGWAWTRAVMGLPVEELHVCGEVRAVGLMIDLCKMCGDEYEVREYKRLTPLKIAKKSLGSDVSKVESGDCVVAFSRKRIYELKSSIEKSTHHRCCVVYGSLPPQARKEQARLFNERHLGNSPYDVMVASDAIGMGLNLEIKRIVFSQVQKFDGEEMRTLTHSEILQIAGRAGRYGTESSHGVVTTLHETDMGVVGHGMKATLSHLRKACLRPELSTMVGFAAGLTERWRQNMITRLVTEPNALELKEPPLHMIIAAFMEVHQADSLFFLSKSLVDMMEVAEILKDVNMPLKDRFVFCASPIDVDVPLQCRVLIQMAQMFSQDREVYALDRMMENRDRAVPSTAMELKQVEEVHNLMELYIWLANQFEEQFVDAPIVREMVVKSNDLITLGLNALTRGSSPMANQKVEREGVRKAKMAKSKKNRKRLKLETKESLFSLE